jgi:hypothetical protein
MFLRRRTFVPIPRSLARVAELEMRIGRRMGTRELSLSRLNNILQWISYLLAVLALAAGIGLLVGDAKLWAPRGLSAALISATPLLLVSTSFLIIQPILRPRLMDLMKNVLLAATFLLWGIIQLLPHNTMSIRLGNVVIALYVLDLAWVILGSKISSKKN